MNDQFWFYVNLIAIVLSLISIVMSLTGLLN